MLQPLCRIDETLVLLPPDPSFAEALFQLVSRQHQYLGQWLSWVRPDLDRPYFQRLLRECRLLHETGHQLTAFIFFEDNLAGSLEITRIDRQNRRAEFGYWLSEDLQGRGIVTRAGSALLDLVFDRFDLHRIEVRITAGNLPSLAVARRLGFLPEATLRQHFFFHGRYHDVEILAILNSGRPR